MQICAILNRDGGTLRTMDVDAFAASIEAEMQAAGHGVSIRQVSGNELIAAIDEAIASRECDAVMAAGGDGTVAAAAAKLMDTHKALAVLPAGTMNLFARSLGIPLNLDEAVAALAAGSVRQVDVATANGRPFIHQFSIGMHPKLIRLRERHSFASRLGKIRASVMASVDTLLHPPRMRLRLVIDGEERTVTTSSLGITNNLFGEGHLPYADEPDGGVLGVYVTRARRRRDIFRFVANMAIGRWDASPHVDIETASEVTVHVPKRHSRFGCAMDGELSELETETVVRIHPGALKVVAPALP